VLIGRGETMFSPVWCNGRIRGIDSCRANTRIRPYGIQLIPIDEDVEGGVGRNLLDRGEFGRIASA